MEYQIIYNYTQALIYGGCARHLQLADPDAMDALALVTAVHGGDGRRQGLGGCRAQHDVVEIPAAQPRRAQSRSAGMSGS